MNNPRGTLGPSNKIESDIIQYYCVCFTRYIKKSDLIFLNTSLKWDQESPTETIGFGKYKDSHEEEDKYLVLGELGRKILKFSHVTSSNKIEIKYKIV